MFRRPSAAPKYCCHKATGRAFVKIRGKFHYLGPHGSPESWTAYSQLLDGLAREAYGRIVDQATQPVPASLLTIVELCARYLDYADGYYVREGRPTDHAKLLRRMTIVLDDLYGEATIARFGPKALQEVQQKLVDRGLSRSTINTTCGAIKRMFKWGVSQEIVPAAIFQALATVPGLKMGRTEAPDLEPIRPVADDLVEATLPHLSPVVADMVRFQRFTGCRPGEVCQLRPADVDRGGDVWQYRPRRHKTQHHGRERIVLIGPKAQEVLLPYLLRESDAHCFSPAESEEQRYAEMRAARKTPVQPSQQNRRKPRPARAPRSAYTKDSYRRAIAKAIDKANRERSKEAAAIGAEPELLGHWHPNQLRHARATEIRRDYGLEAAQVTLGHAKADVTQIYAERDLTLAASIARKSG